MIIVQGNIPLRSESRDKAIELARKMVAATKSRLFPKRLNDGDKVITPVVCFPTTINPIIQNNLQPVFVDVEMPSLNPDLDKVEAALKADPDIKGIMFAHVLGNPPDMDRLMHLVEKLTKFL